MRRRLFDVTVAMALLLLFSPVFLGIAAVALVTASRPILFSQIRVGMNGAVFRCWKFRTMRTDAAETLAQLLATDPTAAEEWANSYKLSADPRVTELGRFLRRFDLDELPQLFNVLRGDMSIVGPRPLVPEEASRFGEALAVTTSVRPGLTGVWQVAGRNSISQTERIEADVWYALNQSLWTDLKICFRTPAVLLRGNFGR